MTTCPLDSLMSHVRHTEALAQAGELLGWDMETMMPAKGAAARGEQSAALAAAVHRMQAAPELGDWINAVDPTQKDPVTQRNLALIARDHARAKRMPKALVEELARLRSQAYEAWLAAREANAFAGFAPILKRMVDLKKEEAAALSTGEVSAYDVLLQQFEPDMSAAQVARLFASLRQGVVHLRERIDAAPRDQSLPQFDIPKDTQLALARLLAERFGFDFSAGRLDLSVHPFSSGTGGDVRITTRVDQADPLDTIYSTIHETGHAVYEQGIGADFAFTPVGRHCSMGVHESQSRLFENQLGRSRSFCTWLFKTMTTELGGVGVESAEHLYRIVNNVTPGFIRTEADEVHYNLHIMLRFDLERDLLQGSLEVDDLEEAWNARFAQDFGRSVPDARRGILQDVHWSSGYIGYFPTYTLGNLYAGQLFQALSRDLPNLQDDLSEGRFGEIISWLRTRIHTHGALYPAPELMRNATGQDLSPAELVAYLDAKYSDLYGL
ncbi:MAG: carboxypeptidase M32 [Pseudomonadota bacterium]